MTVQNLTVNPEIEKISHPELAEWSVIVISSNIFWKFPISRELTL